MNVEANSGASAGLPDARLRLAYLNQNREWALGGLLGLALASRVLGVPIGLATLAMLAVWFLLAAGLAHIAPKVGDTRLQQIEVGYFPLELALITGISHSSGAAAWLVLLFYLVTILYAIMVLPPRAAHWIAGLAAACFSLVLATHWLDAANPVRWFPAPGDGHSFYTAGMLAAVALGGYGLVGATLSQFSRMLTGHAQALHRANSKLAGASQELRQHRDHLEDMVRQRTGDLQKATDELRSANQELLRLNELKSNFLANVSHELRTPLTSIRSFSEILLDYPDEDVFTRCEFLEIIMSESERLTRLINDVLDLAKIESGRMDWRIQPVELSELVKSALEAIQLVASHRGLRLLNVVPAGLPPVLADPDRLRQVITNLLSNAVKFTPAGTIQVGALARSQPGGEEQGAEEVVIYVADTGVGISSRDQAHIFDKFFQRGNPLTDKPGGTGLGLSICREIVSHLGGRIWVESEENRGSIFYCALPLAGEREPSRHLAVPQT